MAIQLEYARGKYFRPRTGRAIALSAAAALAWPLALLASLYGTWLSAWVSLGHCPRPSLDDPKQINGVVSLIHLVATLLLVFWPAGVVAGIAVAPFAATLGLVQKPRGWSERIALVSAILIPCAWAAAIACMYTDPGGVLYWFWD